MKKILLSLIVIASAFASQSQVVVAGVSPANIQGSYDFGVQAACGAWPGETDDGTWGVLSILDFNVQGTFIQAELMLIEDGTPGTNPQGNPISQEGCSAAINDLTGKIAVIFRNSCNFSTKMLNAQNAGALAVIIVNKEDAGLGMTAGADGLDVTIPGVILENTPGMVIVNEMANGPVVMFIGNKLGAFANDLGTFPEDILIPPYAGASSVTFNGFDLAMQMYNYGSAVQAAATVVATITDPTAAVVYTGTVNLPVMNSGDTVYIVNGNPEFFDPFTLPSYLPGTYTLTYTLDAGVVDDFAFDNVFTYDFTLNPETISRAPIDASNAPTSDTYPSNSNTEYQSCMFYEDPNASALAVEGVYFSAYADSIATYPLAGEEININFYLWNDTWTDLADPSFGLVANDFFTDIQIVDFIQYYPASDAENGITQYVELNDPLFLSDNQRYLICLQTFNNRIAFGYDAGINYSGNQSITAMPNSPVFVDDTWYTGGWNGTSASSIGLRAIDATQVSVNELKTIEGSVYPNPASDVVTISIEASGSANLIVSDVSGKLVFNDKITLVNGQTTIDINSLESGVYIFNVTLETGETSQFNVVKK
jgi:hypothetical protein